MKIKCLHGFFIFEETQAGQLSKFINVTGLDLSPWRNYFTFTGLENAPDYSIQGSLYLNFPAIKTCEGEPWEIFEQNEIVYDFTTGLIVPISSIKLRPRISHAGNKFVSDGLFLPGSLTDEGLKIKSYAAWFSHASRFMYSEVTLG